MTFIKHLISLTVILVCSVLIVPGNVYAYLDAGSGSYILQIIIAAFVTGVVAVKVLWNKIKSFFGSLFSKQSEQEMKKD
jgi:hypothetical protein